MSVTLAKRPLNQALDDAITLRDMCFRYQLPLFDRWEIAGSVRRRVPEVGDVDHVVIPKIGPLHTKPAGLFNADHPTGNLLWERVDELVARDHVTKHVRRDGRTCWGSALRSINFRGTVHQIWLADVDNWGSRLAIYTGPAALSHRLVNALQSNGYWNNGTYVWKKDTLACPRCGWCRATSAPLLLSSAIAQFGEELPIRDAEGKYFGKPKFQNGKGEAVLCPNCKRGDELNMERVPVPTEESYFALCGITYLRPEARR